MRVPLRTSSCRAHAQYNENFSLIKFGIMCERNSTGKRSCVVELKTALAVGPTCLFGPPVAGNDFFIENIVRQFQGHTDSLGRDAFVTETSDRTYLLHIAPTLTASFTSEYDIHQT
jgi:hypothetical protein